MSIQQTRGSTHSCTGHETVTRAPSAQGLAKIDSSKLMARLLGMVAPLIAQPVSRGALSTLYAATAPELTGACAAGGVTRLWRLLVWLFASAGLQPHECATSPWYALCVHCLAVLYMHVCSEVQGLAVSGPVLATQCQSVRRNLLCSQGMAAGTTARTL